MNIKNIKYILQYSVTLAELQDMKATLEDVINTMESQATTANTKVDNCTVSLVRGCSQCLNRDEDEIEECVDCDGKQNLRVIEFEYRNEIKRCRLTYNI